MRTKALVLVLFVAGLVVSAAVAAPAHKGKGGTDGSTATTTTATSERHGEAKRRHAPCRPRRAIVLRGTFVGPGAGGFAMAVTGGNRLGRKLAGKQITVLVVERTKIRRQGRAELADLRAGDRLHVKGRACSLDEQAMTLVAKRVVAHTPSGPDRRDGKDESEGGSSTAEATTLFASRS
jgi:hypothetical protein